ncbi:MAG: hypothetical protein O2867_10230 [Bacteroidetes bacterium]|nr:hypothetical protein [Bacteroidota bacterium]
MERIRMIWDFRGPDAELTAAHHARHLKEFCDKEAITHYGHGHQLEQGQHYTAYVIIDKGDMIPVRDALRPVRATYETSP